MKELRDILIYEVGFKANYVESLLSAMQLKVLKQKEFFIKEGTVCTQIGFVKTGVLRSFVYGSKDEHNTDFYFQNHFVSAYSSFLTQLPTEYSIQALTASDVYCPITS